jgi:hypothetical protein
LLGLGDPSPLTFPDPNGTSGAGSTVLLGNAEWTLTDRVVTVVRERHSPEKEILANGIANGNTNTGSSPVPQFLNVASYPSNVSLSQNSSFNSAWKNDSGSWVYHSGATMHLGRIISGNNYLEVFATILPSGMTLTESLPGDFNGSGSVGADDYVIWRKAPPPLGPFLTNFNTWRGNFGGVLGSGAGSGSSTNVPEPACLMLLVLGTAVSLLRHHRGRSHNS